MNWFFAIAAVAMIGMAAYLLRATPEILAAALLSATGIFFFMESLR